MDKEKKYVNYHCHSNYSNIIIADSPVRVQAYIDRIKKLGHTTYVSTEHGNSFGWVEKYLECEKNNIKFVFGVEAYIENNNHKTYHLMLVAKNINGLKSINRALNYATINNFSNKRPKLTVGIIKEYIEPQNVICTSACALGILKEESLQIFMELKDFFKENFFLEIMAHNTNYQKKINSLAYQLSAKYNIPLIAATDSHYIYPKQESDRDDLIVAKRISYNDDEDELGCYMDYPSYDTLFERFKRQGIFSDQCIIDAIDRTNIISDFEDIFLDKSLKVPTVYPNLTRRERCEKLMDIVNEKWDNYKKYVEDKTLYGHYIREIKGELHEWFASKMEDYALTTMAILEKGINYGGVITPSGRGSCSSYITNMLFGFSTVDRLSAKVPMIPERFMTADKIIKSHSTPDIDNNISELEPFIKAQQEILGEGTNYPLVAFGTLKAKSAFKMLCKAKGDIPIELQNEMSNRITAYNQDVLYADEEDKDHIYLIDYLDNDKLTDLYYQGQEYFGLITDLKRHASAFAISNDQIGELFGLIRTPAGDIVLNLEGKYMDELGYVKLDWLIVKSVKMMDIVYKAIGIPIPSTGELYNLVKGDQLTWDIYKKGYTCCVNQVEQTKTREKVMRFMPQSVEELCAFVAAIRPGFKSYYKRFENREYFEFSLKELDELLQGEFLDSSWILYQESIMLIITWLGFEKKDAANLMKAISKKKKDKIEMISVRFHERCVKEFLDNGFSLEESTKKTESIWTVILDAARYSFNASHAYCMALDSLYIAYAKAHYPKETYLTLIDYWSKEKDIEKVYRLKLEAKEIGIEILPHRFGQDNRTTHYNEKGQMVQMVTNIKEVSADIGELLYQLKDFKGTYIDFYKKMIELKIGKKARMALIKTNYFEEFGHMGQLLYIENCYKEYTRCTMSNLQKYYNNNKGISLSYEDFASGLSRIAESVTEKSMQFKNKDDFFKFTLDNSDICDIISLEKIYYEVHYLGSTSRSDVLVGKIVNTQKPNTKKILLSNSYNGTFCWYTKPKTDVLVKEKDIIYIPNVTEKHWKFTNAIGELVEGVSLVCGGLVNLSNMYGGKK